MRSKQSRYDHYYSDIASLTSRLSHDTNIKVGSVIVKDGQILSQGWNGMPSGMDNNTRTDGITNPEVIHSEANALMKLARNGGSADGSTIYTTHSPCYTCSGLVLQSGIRRVVFQEVYDEKAIKFLKERGLEVVCITGSD